MTKKQRAREKRPTKKKEKRPSGQIQPKYSCSKCKGTGMIKKDYSLFERREPCDQCDIWQKRVQELIPK